MARVKTIILVHTSGLLEQWCERLRAFAPRLTVGVHKQSQIDVECDVLVAMIQTVARRPYAGGELRNRGLVIVDEAHHLGARVYGSAMAKLACRYTLGLSATPDRRDGLTRIQFMTLGTIIHKAERVHQNVHVTELLLPAVGGTATNASGRPNFAGMINELARSRERSDLLAAHLRRLRRGRAILVLSERSSSCSTCTRRCGAAASTRRARVLRGRLEREEARGASRRARSPSRPSRWRARASTSRGSTASSSRRRARPRAGGRPHPAQGAVPGTPPRSCSTPSTRTPSSAAWRASA